MNVVSVIDLCKSFENVKALDGVSFSVNEGEVFGILGPDGAGKTTLLRTMAGVMSTSSGKIDILGCDVTANIESAKQHIGYLSQKFSLYSELTVSENIDFFSRLFKVSPSDSQNRKKQLLDFSRLGPYADRRAKHLSGGMKQKLALCCALIHTPRILILDEPTTGVDPISRREFWKILSDLLTMKVTIIFATPYMDEAERANRVALLYEGKILSCDSPENLKDRFKYHLVELVADDNRRAKKALQNILNPNDIVSFGDKLHVKFEDYDSGIELINKSLKESGINIKSVNRITPGMEDVFIDAIT